MRFTKVIGKFDPEIVRKAEERLSIIFTELSLNYTNTNLGTGIGGDPLIFNLVYPVEHVCAEKLGKMDLRTAATDGKRYYWNPHFVLKLPKMGLRFVIAHEAWHAIYMHPQRRGVRHPRLWNICVDYKVNGMVLDDLKVRGKKDASAMYKENLGDYITMNEYGEFLKDPFNPPARIAHLNPINSLYKTPQEIDQENHPPMYFADPDIPDDMKRPEKIYDMFFANLPRCPDCARIGMYKYPDEKYLPKEVKDRKKDYDERLFKELTEDLKKLKEDLEKAKAAAAEEKDEETKKYKEDKVKEIEKAIKETEDFLKELNNKIAVKNKKGKKPSKKGSAKKGSKKQDKDQQEQHSCGDKDCQENDEASSNGEGESDEAGEGEGEGEPDPNASGGSGSCCKNCPTCNNGNGEPNADGEKYFDPFNIGNTLDDHVDADASQDELNKRMSDAIENTKKMAGKIPGGLEDELGILTNPKLTWQDFVRMVIIRRRDGKGRNDWTRFKTRPMFAKLMIPKQRTHHIKFLCAFDCSGSMSNEDIAFGLSQLRALEGFETEGYLLPFDTVPYFDKMVRIQKTNVEELKKAKPMGRGGTAVNDVFKQYEEHIKDVDLIIILSDMYLSDHELTDVKTPKCPTVWICTSDNQSAKIPFGRIFNLHNM